MHVERRDEERAPLKAKKIIVEGSTKGKPKKRWKEVKEKDMLIRGLKRVNAQVCCLWKLGCKKQLTPACEENIPKQMNDK